MFEENPKSQLFQKCLLLQVKAWTRRPVDDLPILTALNSVGLEKPSFKRVLFSSEDVERETKELLFDFSRSEILMTLFLPLERLHTWHSWCSPITSFYFLLTWFSIHNRSFNPRNLPISPPRHLPMGLQEREELPHAPRMTLEGHRRVNDHPVTRVWLILHQCLCWLELVEGTSYQGHQHILLLSGNLP